MYGQGECTHLVGCDILIGQRKLYTFGWVASWLCVVHDNSWRVPVCVNGQGKYTLCVQVTGDQLLSCPEQPLV